MTIFKEVAQLVLNESEMLIFLKDAVRYMSSILHKSSWKKEVNIF